MMRCAQMRQLEETLADFAVNSQPELRAWCHQVLNAVVQLRTATYQNSGIVYEYITVLN